METFKIEIQEFLSRIIEVEAENIDEAISKNKIDKEEYIINFDGDGLVALLVGGLCLYTGFMFTFQVAVRLIQLAYL